MAAFQRVCDGLALTEYAISTCPIGQALISIKKPTPSADCLAYVGAPALANAGVIAVPSDWLAKNPLRRAQLPALSCFFCL
jgi:hypothetical protein